MAASVNNIAATFASALSSSSDNHPPSSLPLSTAGIFSSSPSAAAASVRPISASWNPHAALPRSFRSSLVSLYGSPAPLRPLRSRRPSSPSIFPGDRLPASVVLSFLDTDTDTPRSVSLLSLTRGRKAVLLSVPGAFLSPGRLSLSLSAETLISKSKEMKDRGAGAVGVISANDVFVMRAWGERLGAAEAGVTMLSDPDAELARAAGMAADLRGGPEGFGVRSKAFCFVVAANGTVKGVFADGDGGFDSVIRAL